MKKLILVAALAAVSTLPAMAQRSFEVGFSSGITNYFGDLGNDSWIQATSTQPGAAITFRNFLGAGGFSGNFYRPFSMEVRLSWNRLQYDESEPIGGRKGFDLRNYGRGIGFRNDLFGTSVHFSYTYYANPKMPTVQTRDLPFLCSPELVPTMGSRKPTFSMVMLLSITVISSGPMAVSVM
jgi:hypothetical protein